MTGLKIGTLVASTGTSAPTIRYYEQIGLLPRADRRRGGQRTYNEADVRRLTFIRRCRDFGFAIKQVRVLVALMQDRDRSFTEARDVANAQRNAVRAKLAELRALERSIAGIVQSCDTSCVGGPAPDCVIFEDAAHPSAKQPACSAGRTKSP